MKITIGNHIYNLRQIPARQAQKYIYILQECSSGSDIDLMKALVSPEYCEIMDKLLDFVELDMGSLRLPLNDKNIDDAGITVKDIIEIKGKLIEQLLLPLKNEDAPNIEN